MSMEKKLQDITALGESIENSREPDYLHNPDKCPCPRSADKRCPRGRNCEECIAYHRSNPDSPKTYCERKASAKAP